MRRIEISKVADSQFKPNYVQAQDFRNLGPFMVAKLKTTGILDMQTEKDYRDIDGKDMYAILPVSMNGMKQDIRTVHDGVFSFWYSGHISFVAKKKGVNFTAEEEKEVVRILSTFRLEDTKN